MTHLVPPAMPPKDAPTPPPPPPPPYFNEVVANEIDRLRKVLKQVANLSDVSGDSENAAIYVDLLDEIHQLVREEATMREPPVRLCCFQRHYGAQCPDGRVMCCVCFNSFVVADLATENGVPLDVCKACAA